MLSKDKEYVVDIVDIGQGGVGVGKYDGFTVFVDGGLINDKVKVKYNGRIELKALDEVYNSYDIAKVAAKERAYIRKFKLANKNNQ